MDPSLFRQLVERLGEALELPRGDRVPFLQDAFSGDEALLSEALALLARAEATSFEAVTEELGAGVARAAAAVAGAHDPLPEFVGPYRILERLGEGGMGVVYRGERTEPVRREVAIKVVRAGLRSVEARARFDAERQALALMDHPNVARILDGGTTTEGVPYFAMELVRGEAITDFCDAHGLDLDTRIELVRQVCRGVQHAHTKGIVHRDLKPSNILVSMVDNHPVPRVIDFGIAKILEAASPYEAMLTSHGSLMGTLEYMSPEQASGGRRVVDIRSDVYALGVILYQLASGSLPFESETLRSAGPLEARRLIQENDPPPPATRFRKTSDRDAIADRRGLDPPTLERRLRGPLGWIIQRALEREPDRRYQSVRELAADLDRLQSLRPVRAGPRSRRYWAGLFLRRHRAAATAAALVTLALVAGGAAATAGFLRATEEQERAQSVSDFLSDMLASVRPDMDGRDVTVREVLDEARRRLEEGRFADDPETESALALVMGHSYEGLGLYDEAVPLMRRSVDLRQAAHGPEDPRVYQSLYRLGTVLWKKGDLEESLAIREDLVTLTEKTLGRTHRDYAESVSNLANTKADMGDFDGAEPHLREAVEIGRVLVEEAGEDELDQAERDLGRFLNNYGAILMDLERHDEAVRVLEEMIEIRARREGPTSDVYAIGLVNLGGAQSSLGRLEDAEATLRRAAALHEDVHGPDHPRTAAAYASLGSVLYKQGRHAEAEEAIRHALEIRIASYGESHWLVALLRQRLAVVIMDEGRLTEAEALLAVAWESMAATQDPASGWVREVAAARARLYERMGDDEAAAAWAARAAVDSSATSTPHTPSAPATVPAPTPDTGRP